MDLTTNRTNLHSRVVELWLLRKGKAVCPAQPRMVAYFNAADWGQSALPLLVYKKIPRIAGRGIQKGQPDPSSFFQMG